MITKILNFFEKLNRPETYGVLCILFGVAFLFLPAAALDVLLLVAGLSVTAAGIVRLSVVFSDRDGSVFFGVKIIREAILIFLGVSVAIIRTGLTRTVVSGLGIYVAVWSVLRLISVVSVPRVAKDREWWCATILSVILIVLGLWMAIYPIYTNILTGVALIVKGIELITKGKRGKKGGGSNDGSSTDYISTDFRDIS